MYTHSFHTTASELIFKCEVPDELQVANFASHYTMRKAIEARVSLVKLCTSYANFRSIDFEKLDLTDAVFEHVDFTFADFTHAKLKGTQFIDCDLRMATMDNAVISKDTSFQSSKMDARVLSWREVDKVKDSKKLLALADLSIYKNDLIAQVLKLPNELDALLEAITNGNIDGTTYSAGDCVCLAGTLARSFGTPIHGGEVDGSEEFGTPKLKMPLDSSSPREEWFARIHPGDNPENNIHSYFAAKWVKEAIAIRNNVIRRSKKFTKGLSPMTARAYEIEASEMKIILPPTKD